MAARCAAGRDSGGGADTSGSTGRGGVDGDRGMVPIAQNDNNHGYAEKCRKAARNNSHISRYKEVTRLITSVARHRDA